MCLKSFWIFDHLVVVFRLLTKIIASAQNYRPTFSEPSLDRIYLDCEFTAPLKSVTALYFKIVNILLASFHGWAY